MQGAVAKNMRLLSHDTMRGFGGVGEGMSLQIAKDGRRILWIAHEWAPKNFTGIDAPYEAPEQPEIHLQTTGQTPAQLAKQILDVLLERKIIGLSGEPLSFGPEWFRGTDI